MAHRSIWKTGATFPYDALVRMDIRQRDTDPDRATLRFLRRPDADRCAEIGQESSGRRRIHEGDVPQARAGFEEVEKKNLVLGQIGVSQIAARQAGHRTYSGQGAVQLV